MHTFWKHKEATDKQQSFNGNRSFKFFAIPAVKVTVLYRSAGGFKELTGYLGLALVFVRGGAQWGGGLISIFKSFLLVLTKLSFWLGDLALGFDSMGFRHFPDVS